MQLTAAWQFYNIKKGPKKGPKLAKVHLKRAHMSFYWAENRKAISKGTEKWPSKFLIFNN